MTDTNNEQTPQSSDNDVETNLPSELETLKARADLMGLSYHPNIGLGKLKERIEASVSGDSVTEEAPVTTSTSPAYTGEMLTEAEFKKLRVRKRRQNASSLIRVRIVCMNPNKKDKLGIMFHKSCWI